jgi:hypothetical protein
VECAYGRVRYSAWGCVSDMRSLDGSSRRYETTIVVRVGPSLRKLPGPSDQNPDCCRSSAIVKPWRSEVVLSLTYRRHQERATTQSIERFDVCHLD